MPFFACTMMLNQGSIVRPGNWGRIVRLIGPAHRDWQREIILEDIRKTEFPILPSRLESAFVIDELDEAQYYTANFAKLSLLYEVALIDDGAPTHEADWKGTGPYDNTNEWARRYWRGDVVPHPETTLKLRERLTLSRLRIERQVV
ncbi:DUF2441 domain-containing protein [Bradyrhizobium liaoningense]|uniref:DUF2441 domain-containing protein n=1 Tax=Bradyrhizobium liaoningense TaxID=43992 RepID=UPI001BA7D432|nr:DUF2441 domain-containing protein [Bradyrhizobium liaoningense]MBR0714785.1 DUF2441 domain-containing protein [Bradyrhizobium liaoningense]